jgi:hypothetical protein
MTTGVGAPVVSGADRVAENPRRPIVVPTHAMSPRPARWTAHCHAATAQLTREYQGDHRRHYLTLTTTDAVTRQDDRLRATPP